MRGMKRGPRSVEGWCTRPEDYDEENREGRTDDVPRGELGKTIAFPLLFLLHLTLLPKPLPHSSWSFLLLCLLPVHPHRSSSSSSSPSSLSSSSSSFLLQSL